MNKPPLIFLRFFRWFCRPELQQYIEGDLMELYQERIANKNRYYADVRFLIDVLFCLRPAIIKPIHLAQPFYNSFMMKNYFTIGWRNLSRNKGYSAINLFGLATGMAVAILIGLWVHDEFSTDMHFKNYDRIAQVLQNQTFDGEIKTWGSQAMQLGAELRDNYGNYFERVVIGTFPSEHKITYRDKTITSSGSFVEPELPNMLSLEMVAGTTDGLMGLNGVMLSKSAAHSLFGDSDPINKNVRIDLEFDAVVTGVFNDLPANSSFSDYKAMLSWQIINPAMEKRVGWGNSWFRCLVELREGVDVATASAGIKDAKMKRVREIDDDARFKPALFLHPMSRWRLYSEFENGVSVGGQIEYVRMFSIIGVIVLLLACINFMNLSTARSERRGKEVGIRKAIGSARVQLISQFFTESLLVAMLSLVFALIIVQLSLPAFNQIAGKAIVIAWHSPLFWIMTVGFAMVTGLLSGTYPALFLSSFQPVQVLKGTFRGGRGAFVPRKVLVVLQFTMSVTLIICTVIIFKQIRFAQSRPLGYGINGLLSIPIRDGIVMKHFEALRDDLLKTGVVAEVSASESAITSTFTTNSGFTWSGKDPNRTEEFVTMGVTHEFGRTIGWNIKEGRDFSRDIATDTAGFIINVAAAKYLGFQDPIGETLRWGKNGEWRIIGIVDDMITQSPYNSVKPMIFFLESNRISWINYNVINIRMTAEANATAVDKIAPVFKKYDAENPFSYNFPDQEFGRKFDNEVRIGNLAIISTVLAIFISALGLFGLASFVASTRTKEIGIRKLLGASVSQLWHLLSKDFVVLVAISCLLSVPVAFYFMNEWLLNYEYRVDITWYVYALSCLGALAVALLAVSYQSLSAALNSPVGALRAD